MKYTAYENRIKTDKFFTPDMGTSSYEGELSDMIHWVEKEQLLDPVLWKIFVEQFRMGNADDHDNGWRGEYWGKMMRGACFTYAYTQNEELYRILENTVEDILSTQDLEGRISCYSTAKEFQGWDMWARKYVLLGLQYFMEICNNDDLADRVLKSMCRQADYIMDKVGDDKSGKLLITETSHIWGGLNSSSILEPIVRLYHLTGEKRYLDFAATIIETGGTKDYDIFRAMLDGKEYPYECPYPKAYEMISNFEGIIEYYRATGEEKYKTIAINFARMIIESEITIVGSAGTMHEIFDHGVTHQFDPEYTHLMQETCVTITWMKFCYQLLCLTGEELYAEQIEKSVYNALKGAINVNGNVCDETEDDCGKARQVFAFDSYSPIINGVRGRGVGGMKDVIKNRFWWGCCVAIGAAGTGLIGMVSNMKAKDGMVVNFYQPGDYRQTFASGNVVTLHTDTAYPVAGDATLTVFPEREENFALYIRIPGWSRKTSVKVCGENVSVVAGSYAKIERTWKQGDVVEIEFDMSVQIIRATDLDENTRPEAACHAALQRGPLVLARDAQFGEDVTSAVKLTECNGYAVAEISDTEAFENQVEYRIQTENGYITVADYASCGQSWEKDKPITVWITTK